jgi:hypothetical protein
MLIDPLARLVESKDHNNGIVRSRSGADTGQRRDRKRDCGLIYTACGRRERVKSKAHPAGKQASKRERAVARTA